MRWPPWRHRTPPPLPRRRNEGLKQAKKAAEHAEERLREAQYQWSEVRKVTDALAAHRKSNHFSESISEIFRGTQ